MRLISTARKKKDDSFLAMVYGLTAGFRRSS